MTTAKISAPPVLPPILNAMATATPIQTPEAIAANMVEPASKVMCGTLSCSNKNKNNNRESKKERKKERKK